MRKIVLLLIMTTFAVLGYSQDSLTQVDVNGRLQVKGAKLISSIHGKPVQLRGMSMFWSQWSEGSKYYKASVVDELVDDWKVNVIRASMGIDEGGSGYLSNPSAEKQKVFNIVDACIAKGIYVIIDWHSHVASDQLKESKIFFAEMAQKYGEYPNVMYEIYNEPLNEPWSTSIQPYCQALADTIRVHDEDNLIICGTRLWSQRVDEVAAAPVIDTNVAYTLHYYASSHKQSLRDIAQTAINQGVPIFVTEFGTCEASGAGKIDFAESNTWWDFLEKNDISWCNWAVGDKDEAASALTPKTTVLGNWNKSNYTISGAFVRDKLRASYQAPRYENNMQVEVAKGYELLYTTQEYQFDIKVYNEDTLVNKDSVKYYLYVSNGGDVSNTGLFTPDGTTGSFKLFIEAVYDTLRTTKEVEFLITDLLPSELKNDSDKTYLALTLDGQYKFNSSVKYPTAINYLIPASDIEVEIEDQTYTWAIVNESEGAFSVADSAVKSYLAIYVTNPVARTAKLTVKQVGTNRKYVNGKLTGTNTFPLLKGQNVIVLEYQGTVDSSYFDFTILETNGDTMPFLSYTTIPTGKYDCNNTWRGEAIIADCGCIGGTTGLNNCPGPFHGVPASIPGRIQAQEYDFGKSGETFFDTSIGNNGDSDLRKPDDVDISNTNDGNGIASIGWIDAGEWLKYTVDVLEEGAYVVDFRVASGMTNGGSLQLKKGSVKLYTKDVLIANTSGWNTWKTVTSDTIFLPSGVQSIVFESMSGAFNLNYMDFRKVKSLGVENQLLVNYSLYPNPYTTTVVLESETKLTYSIVDVAGTVVEKGECNGNCSLGEKLVKGIYFLELIEGEKRRVERLVKF